MPYVIDSSALVEIMHGTQRGEHVLELTHNSAVVITSLALYEALIGAKEQQRMKMGIAFRNAEVVSFDKEAAFMAIELNAKLHSRGQILGAIDTMIAGICLKHGLPLITGDRAFQRVPNLEVKII